MMKLKPKKIFKRHLMLGEMQAKMGQYQMIKI